jgi:hypothetical protein
LDAAGRHSARRDGGIQACNRGLPVAGGDDPAQAVVEAHDPRARGSFVDAAGRDPVNVDFLVEQVGPFCRARAAGAQPGGVAGDGDVHAAVGAVPQSVRFRGGRVRQPPADPHRDKLFEGGGWHAVPAASNPTYRAGSHPCREVPAGVPALLKLFARGDGSERFYGVDEGVHGATLTAVVTPKPGPGHPRALS